MKRIHHIQAERVNFGRHFNVHMATKADDNGKYLVALPLAFEARSEDEYRTEEPTITLEPTAAQLLMDELWRCGLRPTEGTGSAGALAATQKHLDDMRTIAMGSLRKKGAIE